MLTCTFEDGGQTNRLRHATVSPIVVKDTTILLVKRALHMTTCPGMYALPGGYMNNDERIAACAQREVYEETGYETINPQLFLINDIDNRKNEDRQNLDIVVLLDVGVLSGVRDNENSEISWFDLNHLPPKEMWGFDHYEMVQRYVEYLKHPCPLPIIDFKY